MQKEQPCLGIFQCFDELVALETLLFDTGVVAFGAEDSLSALFLGEKVSGQRAIWKAKLHGNGEQQCYKTGDNVEPFPGRKGTSLDEQDTIGK